MVGTKNKIAGGPLAPLRAARHGAPLFLAPESVRGRRLALLSLTGLTVGIFFLSLGAGFHVAPPLTLVIPVVLGGFLLQRRALEFLLLVVVVGYFSEVAAKGWDSTRPGGVVVLAVVAAIALEL